MNKTQAKRYMRLNEILLGLDVDYLLAKERRLHRWAERECNGEIERDDDTGKAFLAVDTPKGRALIPTNDLEAAALRAIKKALHGTPWKFYHQTDPRGCALYLYTDRWHQDSPYKDTPIEDCYAGVGVAVYL